MPLQGIFITGLGIISPLGRGRTATLQAIKTAASGIRTTNIFGVSADQEVPVAPVDIPVESEDSVPRTHALALAAARDAVQGKQRAPDAIVIGVTTGGMPKTEVALREKNTVPETYAYHGAGTVATYLASRLSCTGPAIALSTACSSGTAAIKIAIEMLRQNKAASVLVGGVDALCRFTYFGFYSLQLLDPAGARPLDKDRAGITLGEGAAMLLLEAAQNPPPGSLARILGGGISCDAYHPTAPHPTGEGALTAMRDALSDAGLPVSGIGYINLHGTATKDNDASEAKALRSLFGDDMPPLSSTKGMTGHSLGAAGAVEAALCALSVAEGIIPGNTGCTVPDPSLGIVPILATESRPVKAALSNSFGFGGNNAAVVIGALDTGADRLPRTQPKHLTITGLACLTGSGELFPSFEQFSQGKSVAGILTDEAISKDLPQRQVRRLKRLPRMALALATAAYKHAGTTAGPSSIFFGTGWGPLTETYDFLTKLFESDMKFSSPTDFINSVHNAPAGQVAMEFKSRGANMTATGGDYSFEQALLIAGLLASEREELLLFGADETHRILSPLLDPSSAGDPVPSDGGGAIMAVASSGPAAGPSILPLGYAQTPDDPGHTVMNALGLTRDITDHYGAVFAGIPAAHEALARQQLAGFLEDSGFRGPVIDYRKYTGQYAAASAVATVLAVQTLIAGSIPAGLTGNAGISLGNKGILVMGFGPYCTALGVRPS